MSYPAPILNLNFANAKQLVHPAVSFSRGSAGAYFDSSGVMRYANNSVPRFDHDPLTGICKGLLVEPAVTFLDTYSEQFDNAAWNKTMVSVSANAAVAPDGSVTADKIFEDTSSDLSHKVDRYVLPTSSTTYTYSFFAKCGERSIVQCTMDAGFNGTTSSVKFDLSLVSATVVSGAPTYGIKSIGSGYCLCWITVTASASPSNAYCIIYLHNGTSITYTGDGTSGLYIWGAKLYAGTGPTSYLPTTSAGVTRAADVCSVDLTKLTRNGSPLWTGTEGTIVVDAVAAPWSGVLQKLITLYSDSNNRLEISRTNAGYMNFYSKVAGTFYTGITSINPGNNTRLRVAAVFGGGSVEKLSINGATVVAGTNALVTQSTTMSIGCDNTGAVQWGGTIRSVQLYNRRIADAYLPALSAL